MPRVTKRTTVCDRDALGREKPATATRRFTVEGTKYKLALCEDHARMFDREMAAWSRLAAEEESAPQTFGSSFATDARRAAELRARQAETRSCSPEVTEREEPADNVHQFTPLLSHRTHRLGQPVHAEVVEPGQRYSNGWLLTPHAKERAEQRGYGIDEVLRAAAEPQIAYDDVHHGALQRVHLAGDCAVIVDTHEKVVITVLHRDRAKYALDNHHLTERVAR